MSIPDFLTQFSSLDLRHITIIFLMGAMVGMMFTGHLAVHCFKDTVERQSKAILKARIENHYLKDVNWHYWFHLPSSQRHEARADQERLRKHFYGDEPPVGEGDAT